MQHRKYRRIQAAIALGMLGDLESTPKIRAMLTYLQDENVRAAAALALGDLGDKESLSALKAALEAEPVSWVRHIIEGALKKNKGHISAPLSKDDGRPEPLTRSPSAIS